MDENILYVEAEESGERIDALLSRYVEDLSRNAAQKLLENGSVTLNGQCIKKKYRCSAGELFQVILPEPEVLSLVPQDIPLDVVYEDKHVIVVNKPRGMVVHPAPGHPDGTLVNALLYRCGDTLSGIGGEKRPGIVHRIDRDTTGLIICAKNDAAHRALSQQLSDHSLYREYIAIVNGHFREKEGTVDAPIGRSRADRKKMAVNGNAPRNAVTHWKVLQEYKDYTLVQCRLETGRTHQIRVHMAYIGHPLLGDGVYGAKCPDKGLEGQCLHARRLHFTHPATGEELMTEAEIPDYFLEVLAKLGNPID